jgi:hypothetical protein
MRWTTHVCTNGLGEDRLDRVGEPLQPVDPADQEVGHAALLELAQDLHPELRALALFKPQPEHVALAVDGDPEREVAGAPLHAPALADLEHEAVEEHDRVDVLQRPLRPRADIVHVAARTEEGLLIVNLWPSEDCSHAAAREGRRRRPARPRSRPDRQDTSRGRQRRAASPGRGVRRRPAWGEPRAPANSQHAPERLTCNFDEVIIIAWG